MFAKIFERKWVIRFFGIALILAPFVNTANSVLEIPNIDKKFLFAYCWQFFKSAPVQQQILQISSVVIGVLKLRGSISAWKYTLALLGGYIILQFTQLNAGEKDNTTWMFLGVNVLAFFFIADQIVLKPRPKSASVASSKPVDSSGESPAKPSSVIAAPFEAQAAAPSMVEVATPNGSVFVAAQKSLLPESQFEMVTAPSAIFVDSSPSLKANTAVTLAPATNPEIAFAPPHLHEHLIPENIAPQNNVTPITSHQSVASQSAATYQSATPHQSSQKVYVNFEGFGNWATVSDISESGIKVRAISPAPPEITSRTIELTLGAANLRLKFFQQDGAEYSFNFVALSSQDKQSLNEWLLTAAA